LGQDARFEAEAQLDARATMKKRLIRAFQLTRVRIPPKLRRILK
jgi:hypothetical protein